MSNNNANSALDTLLVWCTNEQLPSYHTDVIHWCSYTSSSSENIISAPLLVEKKADHLRSQYLKIIYDLGETKIKGKRVIDHLELRTGVSYWWMTLLTEKCNYAKSPQIDDAIKLLALQEWLKDKRYNNISLVTSNSKLAEAMRMMAAEVGVDFDWRQPAQIEGRKNHMRQLYFWLPQLMKALAWFVHHLVTRFPLRMVGVSEWINSTGKTLFVSYSDNLLEEPLSRGFMKSHYWAHLPQIFEENNHTTNWLHLYLPDRLLPSAYTVASKFSDINSKLKGKQVHTTLDSFMNLSCVIKSLRDWLSIFMTGHYLKKGVSRKCGALWPLLEDDYDRSFFGQVSINNLLFFCYFERALSLLKKQKTGLYLQENQGWEFGFVSAWKASQNTNLIGVSHVVTKFWDMRNYFDPRNYMTDSVNDMPYPDVIAINSDTARKLYVESGFPVKRLVSVEALRYLYLADNFKDQRDKHHTRRTKKIVLILGDYVIRNTIHQLHLLEGCEHKLEDFHFIIKFHPNTIVDLPDFGKLNFEISTSPINELLPLSDIAYTSSTTSAAVDAYCFGVPVISMLNPNTLNLSPLRGVDDVTFVGTAEQLYSALISTNPSISSSTENNFFFLGSDLPRWRDLLGFE